MTENTKDFIKNDNYYTVIYVKCKTCKITRAITVIWKDFKRYVNEGLNTKEAFPYLTDEDRFLIVSDECLDCHNNRLYGKNLFNMKDVI